MKIFVSSTYLDLKDYRIKAKKAIEDKNEFIGMENFQSHTHEPSEFSAENVEDCDAFVLIVAYRYGSPAEEKKSITQSEYEHALRKKIPVRIYLMDDNHPWPSSPECRDKNPELIDSFRNLLLKKHTCSFFTTPESFYDKLKLDIQKIPIPPAYYPIYPMNENFTGRKQERELLTNWLRKDSHPMLALIAMGGMGKTSLTWYWFTEDIKGSDEQPWKVLWWSFYDTEAGFDRFLRKAIEYFSDEVEWNKLASTRDKMEFLYEILSKNRYLLIIDGVERVLRNYYNLGSPYQGDEIKEDAKGDFRSCIEPNCGMFLQWLASGNTKTKILLTSRLYPKELDGLAGCLRKDLEKMDKEDAVEFFHRQGVKGGTRAEIETVCESVGYHPLYLRLLSGMIVCDPKNPGDIKEWIKYDLIPELKGKEGHNILEFAYNSLDRKKQEFISKLAAFRNPMDWDAIVIFNEFGIEGKLNEVLIELVNRGMLLRDIKSNKFDLHPLVRKYCYDRLKYKEGVHAVLRDYFAVIPEPEKTELIDDLAPAIELYHHTVRAGKYDEARKLFENRFVRPLYYIFGAHQKIIELLSALFPDGEYKPPRLRNEKDQAWALNGLAISYAYSGQYRLAVHLFKTANEIAEKRGDKKNVSISLANLAYMAQIPIGALGVAESNLRRSIEICHEIKQEVQETIGHNSELGRLLAYQGKFKESENELTIALDIFAKSSKIQAQGVVWAYRSLRALLISSAGEALECARKARELADVKKFEIDIIRAEWLFGAAHLMKGNLSEAEKHLNLALIRDRKINMVDYESDILLELAKLRFKQNRKSEALKFAEEALQIADRCEYRLKQADIHNFLAEFYFDAGDLANARQHGEIAKERAGCGYVPALEKAEKLLMEIQKKANRS